MELKYQKIYNLLDKMDNDEVKDFSRGNVGTKYQTYSDQGRQLWIIIENKKLNKRIWIIHSWGKMEILTAQLDLDCKSQEYHKSHKWYKFNNQTEMANFIQENFIIN